MKNVDYETFFKETPEINSNADKIKGVICGHRVEEIKDPLMQKIRWLDKLVDELAKENPWIGTLIFLSYFIGSLFYHCIWFK
jgi:hypothetical protein